MANPGPKHPFYAEHVGDRLAPEIASVYKQWSGLEGKELVQHLHTIRDLAWKQGQYPCIGEWLFLQRSFSRFPQFPPLVDRLRKGASVLDLGCCFGHDLRLLAANGARTENMYAVDLKPEFWELGYQLFRDKHRMKAKFLQADMQAQDDGLQELEGRCDIIIVCLFLHLWSSEQQCQVLKRMVAFSRWGGTVVGYQLASDTAKSVKQKWGDQYIHDLASFRKMWVECMRDSGSEWSISASLIGCIEWGVLPEDVKILPPDSKFVEFVCQRKA